MSIGEIDSNKILMAILGSLVGYVFYGHIRLEATVGVHDIEINQGESERIDLWGKYNDAGEKFMDFLIQDAREKESLREEIIKNDLKHTEYWLEYYKHKSQDNAR